MNIKVKKRNGRLVPFEVEKINRSAERACENLENVSPSEIVLDAKIKLYDKVKTLERIISFYLFETVFNNQTIQ